MDRAYLRFIPRKMTCVYSKQYTHAVHERVNRPTRSAPDGMRLEKYPTGRLLPIGLIITLWIT